MFFPVLFEIFSQLKDETCPPSPLAPQEPDSPPVAMAMCANGIKIRLRTGNFFFCHHNLNRSAKKWTNCRATGRHSSKTNANKYSKKYTRIVCSPAHFDFASKKGLCNWWQNFRNKYWAHKSFCWISFIMHYGQSIDNSLITLLKRSWINLVNMFIAYICFLPLTISSTKGTKWSKAG